MDTRKHTRRRRASASFIKHILHLNTHTRAHALLHMTIYIRERKEERGTAQRELALPRTDAHLTHCTGFQSAFHGTLLAARTSLRLIVKKKRTANKQRKQTGKKHTLWIPLAIITKYTRNKT